MPAGVRLEHEHVAEAVDDEPGQAVRLRVDQAVVGLGIELASERQGAGHAVLDERAVDLAVLVARQQARRDQRAGVEVRETQDLPVRRHEADDAAGRQRLGGAVHLELVRVEPRRAAPQAPVLAWRILIVGYSVSSMGDVRLGLRWRRIGGAVPARKAPSASRAGPRVRTAARPGPSFARPGSPPKIGAVGGPRRGANATWWATDAGGSVMVDVARAVAVTADEQSLSYEQVEHELKTPLTLHPLPLRDPARLPGFSATTSAGASCGSCWRRTSGSPRVVDRLLGAPAFRKVLS
jgi:hypothetical protein